MNKTSAILAILFFAIFLFPFSHSAETADILILHTSDIHSHIFGTDHGWLRVASEIRRLRSMHGGRDKTLLIDCGDTLTGTIVAETSGGTAPAAMLNLLDYDVWILGNHDFELGTGRLEKIIPSIHADTFSANTAWRTDMVKKWKVYEKGGAKIAIIGMTSPFLDHWLWGSIVYDLHTQPLMGSLDLVIPEVMESKPDMIILALHHGRFPPARLGSVNLSAITKKYPQIDLVLGGHVHQENPGEKSGSSSWFFLAGIHGRTLGKIEAKIDLANKRVLAIKSAIIPISDETPQDHDCLRAMQKWENQAVEFKSKLVSRQPEPISGKKLCSLFAMALCHASGAEAAFISPPSQNAILPPATTEFDLYQIQPFNDKVCILTLNEDQIAEIAAEQKAQTLRRQHFHRNSPETASPRKINVAFSSYALAGAGGRFPTLKKIAMDPDSNPRETNILIRDALRSFLKRVNHVRGGAETLEDCPAPTPN
ncbi:MAG: bifunctional metallophosphatase/5'-nucleotidase [Victivallales bacterium]|nr:bifunctional metallophosphatase/5'-nucleotidase [Victivallales bacterium]